MTFATAALFSLLTLICNSQITLYVKQTSGATQCPQSIEVPNEATVGDLTNAIALTMGNVRKQLVIHYYGMELTDAAQPLSDAGVCSETQIEISFKKITIRTKIDRNETDIDIYGGDDFFGEFITAIRSWYYETFCFFIINETLTSEYAGSYAQNAPILFTIFYKNSGALRAPVFPLPSSRWISPQHQLWKLRDGLVARWVDEQWLMQKGRQTDYPGLLNTTDSITANGERMDDGNRYTTLAPGERDDRGMYTINDVITLHQLQQRCTKTYGNNDRITIWFGSCDLVPIKVSFEYDFSDGAALILGVERI